MICMQDGPMEKYDILLPQVLPQVLGCPTAIAIDAIQMVGMDFCRQTGAWTVVRHDAALAYDNFIAFDLPADAQISSVYALELEGMRINDFLLMPRGIHLKNAPARDSLVTARLSLRPNRTAKGLPAEILEEWGDVIAYGALAKLKAMSGSKIEWTDTQGASAAFAVYQEGCARAKADAVRKRLGGAGTLFMNDAQD